MQYFTTSEIKAREEGEAKGRAEGEVKGATEATVKTLQESIKIITEVRLKDITNDERLEINLAIENITDADTLREIQREVIPIEDISQFRAIIEEYTTQDIENTH